MENTSGIEVISIKSLSKDWGKLDKVKYKYKLKGDVWQTQEREVYNRGNGAVILLYNINKGTVILTRQLRIPTWFNGNADGLKPAPGCLMRKTRKTAFAVRLRKKPDIP